VKIFLSFSSADRQVAEAIHVALLGVGCQVFFDAASLPPGSDYNSRIRDAISESDAFVFLISPNSVAPGHYVQTELRLAKARWPRPWGSVLPVMIAPTDYKLIDPYLAAISILEPRGSVAAEVASAIATGLSSQSNAESSVIEDKRSIDNPRRAGGPVSQSKESPYSESYARRVFWRLGTLVTWAASLVASFGLIYLILLAITATGVVEFKAKS